MLEGLMDPPNVPLGVELSWKGRILNVITCSMSIGANVVAYRAATSLLSKYRVPTSAAVAYGTGAVALITGALYVYNVYLIEYLSRSSQRKNGKDE
jgi:hypothetical protein